MSISPQDSFEVLKKSVTDSISSHFPFEGGRQRRLELNKIWVDDNLDTNDISSQAEARINGRTWGVPIKGDISLVDKKTGKTVETKTVTLARLPKITSRYGYIVDGNEFQVDHLFRLKSGIYTRASGDGDLKSEFSLAESPFGNRFSILLDRQTKQITFEKDSTHIPLYPILKAAGVADDDIEKEWGKDIFQANQPKKPTSFEKALRTFYKKTAEDGSVEPTDIGGLVKHVHDVFGKTKLLPETTKITLGKPFTQVTGEVLHLAAAKLLGISRGTKAPDDRDSLAFKEVASIEDFIPEKISRSGRTIRTKLRNSVDYKESISDIVTSDLFGKPIREFFTKGSSVVERSDQTNPIQMLSAHRKTTLMAPEHGGIKNENAITNEMRSINASHLGFLDPMKTPECLDDKSEVFTSLGWKSWPAVSPEDLLACKIDGRLEFHRPERLVAQPYKGTMYGVRTKQFEYLVTPNHRVICRPTESRSNAGWRIDRADAVHGSCRMFPASHEPFQGTGARETFRLPGTDLDIPMKDWGSFMGWFLSEGSAPLAENVNKNIVVISQDKIANPVKYQAILNLLGRLPFGDWGSYAKDFRVAHRPLADYLVQFGYCQDKFIPEHLFDASVECRENLLECLVSGDGRRDSHRKNRNSYKQKMLATTSPRLAAGFERLAVSLGFSTTHLTYVEKREDRYLDVHEIRILQRPNRNAPLPKYYFTEEYDGMVYCATVPGGLLYVRRNGKSGIWTGNSEKTGVSVNLSLQARKRGKDIEVPVYNLKTGKSEYHNASVFYQALAVLPDQVKWSKGKPTPISDMVKMKMPGGAIETRPWKEATFVMPSAKGMFDVTSNLIPFLPCDQGNRVSFADKQMEQAISLKDREAPLVQSKSEHPTDPSHTFEKAFGSFSSHRSPVDGKITSIQHDRIIVTDGRKKHFIHLYDNFPLNDVKGVMHSDPVVKVGDHVKRGQLIADTNFTRGGVLACGTNLRVGYIPYKGYNFEDGIVISETAAKKLTSEHLHKLELNIDPDKDSVSKGKFLAHAQQKASSIGREAIDALDEHGVIKVGTKVKSGQVLVAAVSENKAKSGLFASSYGVKAFRPYKDKSLIWDEDHVGTVVRVVKDSNGKGIKVHVRTEEPTVVGDKLSGRHGNKGIVTQILRDEEMPFTLDAAGEKRPLEILLNPSGVPTRINTGQIMETAAAKIAEKTGKPYVVDNFSGPGTDYRSKVVEELKSHGLSDEESVYDPMDVRKPLGSVTVGPQYIMKLKHQVEKKLSVRGAGSTVEMKSLKYDAENQPSQGGHHGSQGFGQLEVYSLLAHGARHNLREMSTFKSDKQDATFWNRIQQGYEPGAPKVPFAYTKFIGLLQGLGVDVKQTGSIVQLLPMTDARVLELAGGPKGEVKNPHLTIRAKDMRPEKGGLFDHDVTGGPEGTKWGYIKLHEPMPNPIFVGHKSSGPIPSLLNMKMADLEDVITGKKELGGLTGGRAVQQALKNIDVDKTIKELRSKLPNLKSDDLNLANRKLKYLLALQEHGLKPHEAYILNYIPVVPPVFRPVSETAKGDLYTSPLNGLYKNMAITNNALKEFDPKVETEGMRVPLREEIWESLQALQAIGGAKGYDSDSPGSRKKLKGILGIVANNPDEEQPKEGYFQSRLIKKRQDLSIRSTIIPEPKLGLDEVGLPRVAAMELYRPFVLAELVKRSFRQADAEKEIKNGTQIARQALEKVVQDRPIILKRDPALHKFSVMAFKPVLHEGKAIKIHPLVCGGFNADFDGDQQLGSVFLCVNKENLDNLLSHHATIGVAWADRSWWDLRRVEDFVAARFREKVGIVNGGELYLVNLEDFPHESACVTKDHIDFHEVPPGITVISYSEQIGQFALGNVSHWSKHRNRKVEIVTLASGRQIVTDDDPRGVYGLNENLEEVRRRPKEAMGLFVPVAHSLEVVSGSGDLNFVPIPAGDPRMRDRAELMPSFGYLCGVLAGDGWLVMNHGELKGQVALAAADDSVVKAYEESLLSVFLDLPTIAQTEQIGGDFEDEVESRKWVVSSIAYSRLIDPLIGWKAENKHLPPFFLFAGRGFRLGLLAGLIDTDGSVSWSNGKEKPQFMSSFSSRSIRLAQEVVYLSKSLGVRATITPSKTPKGKPQWVVTFSTVDLYKLGSLPLQCLSKVAVWKEFSEGQAPAEKNSYAQIDIIPTTKDLARLMRDNLGLTFGRSLYVVLTNAFERGYISRYSARELISKVNETHRGGLFGDNRLYRRWVKLVENNAVWWDQVESYEVTEQEETGYDLTVPGFETFMSVDGIVLSNTMAGTVPVSKEAVEEAKGMFPSKNLFSSTNYGVMYSPTQESMLGLHLLTKWGKNTGKKFANPLELNKAVEKGDVLHTDVVTVDGKETTFGRLQINSRFPKGFASSEAILHDPKFRITQGKMFDLATDVAKNHSREFGKTINDLKNLGNEHSFKAGFSFGLKDLVTIPGRDAILAAAHKEAAIVCSKIKDKNALHEALVGENGVYTRATKILDASMEQHFKDGGGKNRLMTMVYSGARGKREQLRQMVAAPMLMQDSSNRTVDTPVTRSYAEGLDVGDYWISQHGARKGTLQRAQGTSLPGVLTKDILNTTMNILVTANDCGSKDGVHIDISSGRIDKDVHDRYLSIPYKLRNGNVIEAGTLVTPEVIAELRNSKHDKVVVRSPLKCQQPEGICSKCFGLSESGKLHPIGTNVGILAGQALGEPATQLAMDAFHSGGVAGNRGAGSVDKFVRLRQLLDIPKKFKYQATISKVTGTVTSVKKDLSRGGQEIAVDGHIHYIPREVMGDNIHVGMEVKRGQSLSDPSAAINPHHLLEETDIHAVQNYLTKEIHKNYEKAGVRRRNVEVVVRGMTNLSKVKNPGSSSWNYGDVVSRSVIDDHNRHLKKGDAPVVHVPFLAGIKQAVLSGSEDWMARLNYVGLHGTIIEGAAKSWKSNIHGNNPIPGLARGSEFGKPPPDSKKYAY